MMHLTYYRFIKKKIIITAIIALYLIFTLPAQAQTKDAGLWTTLNFEWAITSRFTFLLSEKIRTKENFTRLNLFNTTIGLECKINRSIKTSLLYRETQKYTQDNNFSFRHRLQWDVSAKKKFGKFDVSYRHRLQTELENVYSSEEGQIPEWYSRNKIGLKYDLNKPIAPYIAGELSYQIRNPRKPSADANLYRTRYQVGVVYNLNPHHELGVYYRIQNKFNIENLESLYIIGLVYSYKL